MLLTENSSVLKYRTPICRCSDHHKLPPPFLKSKMTSRSLLPFPKKKTAYSSKKRKYHLHTKQGKKKKKTENTKPLYTMLLYQLACLQEAGVSRPRHPLLCQEPHRHLNHLKVSYKCSHNHAENTTDALEP